MPGAAVSPVSPVSLPLFPSLPAGLLCLPGLLFFPGLFLLARRALAAIAGCPHGRATVLAARLVSSVQAVMASTAGYIISSSCHHVIDDQHWLAAAYPPFAVPYFVYDVYAMYLCHLQRAQVKGHGDAPLAPRAAAAAFLRQELLMVLHHAAMVLVCFPVATLWRQGKGDFFLGCLLMAELSTPFVCLGKVLILLRRQHTALHKLNGLALLVTFLGCRVLLFPYLYWAYGRHRGLALLRVPAALPPAYNAAAAALAAPQLYWFGLICRGAWRLF
ncbi:PREDICTED: protein FAM57B, partial [Pseudopodoces humilis]|uniref:protein FAM57B n=1 Tax=Pseudopodoces humilis TaxID=181119 RepID=UPI0003956F77